MLVAHDMALRPREGVPLYSATRTLRSRRSENGRLEGGACSFPSGRCETNAMTSRARSNGRTAKEGTRTRAVRMSRLGLAQGRFDQTGLSEGAVVGWESPSNRSVRPNLEVLWDTRRRECGARRRRGYLQTIGERGFSMHRARSPGGHTRILGAVICDRERLERLKEFRSRSGIVGRRCAGSARSLRDTSPDGAHSRAQRDCERSTPSVVERVRSRGSAAHVLRRRRRRRGCALVGLGRSRETHELGGTDRLGTRARGRGTGDNLVRLRWGWRSRRARADLESHRR